MKVFELTDKLNFGKYRDEFVLDIILKDSGYIKSLIFLNNKNPGFILSEKALKIAQLITKGFKEKEPEKCTNSTSFLDQLKSYGGPYDYDFNDEKLIQKNNEKLKSGSNLSGIKNESQVNHNYGLGSERYTREDSYRDALDGVEDAYWNID